MRERKRRWLRHLGSSHFFLRLVEPTGSPGPSNKPIGGMQALKGGFIASGGIMAYTNATIMEKRGCIAGLAWECWPVIYARSRWQEQAQALPSAQKPSREVVRKPQPSHKLNRNSPSSPFPIHFVVKTSTSSRHVFKLKIITKKACLPQILTFIYIHPIIL